MIPRGLKEGCTINAFAHYTMMEVLCGKQHGDIDMMMDHRCHIHRGAYSIEQKIKICVSGKIMIVLFDHV